MNASRRLFEGTVRKPTVGRTIRWKTTPFCSTVSPYLWFRYIHISILDRVYTRIVTVDPPLGIGFSPATGRKPSLLGETLTPYPMGYVRRNNKIKLSLTASHSKRYLVSDKVNKYCCTRLKPVYPSYPDYISQMTHICKNSLGSSFALQISGTLLWQASPSLMMCTGDRNKLTLSTYYSQIYAEEILIWTNRHFTSWLLRHNSK